MVKKIKDLMHAKWDYDVPLSPDGEQYWKMGAGEKVSQPFFLRWLWPYVCKQSSFRWRASSQVVTALLIPASMLMLLCAGVPALGSVIGGFAVVGLAGVWKFNRNVPVLVDAPAMLFTVLSISFALLDWYYWPLAIILACVAVSIKEISILFIFAATLNPYIFIALLIPAYLYFKVERGEYISLNHHAVFAVQHPIQAGMEAHRHIFQNWKLILAPWGGLMICVLFPSWSLLLGVLFAYLLLVTATDTVRLFQWCWPIVLLAVFLGIPSWAWIPVVLLTWFNPYQGDGA